MSAVMCARGARFVSEITEGAGPSSTCSC